MALRHVTSCAGCLLLLAVQAGLAWQTSDKDSPPVTADPSGKPKAFKTGQGLVGAVWHDGEFWNVMTTSKKAAKGRSATHRWGGSVRIEGDTFIGKFDKLEKAKKAANADWVFPHLDGRGFDFQFINAGGRDEIKFKPGPNATTITIKLIADNKGDPKRILIGSKGVHPEKATFSLPAHPTKK